MDGVATILAKICPPELWQTVGPHYRDSVRTIEVRFFVCSWEDQMRARIFSYNPSTIRSDHLMALKHKVDVSPNAQSWWFLLSEKIIMKTGIHQ